MASSSGTTSSRGRSECRDRVFLLTKLRDVLRAPATAVVAAAVGENLPLAKAESIPSREPRAGATLGTSKVWRCFRADPGGPCRPPEELGLAVDGENSGGDENRCAGCEEDWLASAVVGVAGGTEDGLVGCALAECVGVELSIVRMSPLFTVCMYISTGDCCIEPPPPELSELRECAPLWRGVDRSASFVVLAGGCKWEDRSGSVVVDTPFGGGGGGGDKGGDGFFSVEASSGTTPFGSPPWCPSSELSMPGGDERSPFKCGRGSERSEVCVECVELSSKLSLVVDCDCDGRRECPLIFSRGMSYWRAGSRWTTADDCEWTGEFSLLAKDGISRVKKNTGKNTPRSAAETSAVGFEKT